MQSMIKQAKKMQGFSLVELIVVIVILAILIGVTIGGVYQYVGQARVNTDIQNANQIASVLSTLAADDTVYKAVRKLTADQTYTFEWKVKSPVGTGSGEPQEQICDAMAKLLTDGLPASQTGDGFTLTINCQKTGDVAVTCTTGVSAGYTDSTGALKIS